MTVSQSYSHTSGFCVRSPRLLGITTGASLSQKKPTTISCTTTLTPSVKSFEWFVNGRKVWEDLKPLNKSGKVTSCWLFTPEPPDEVIQCKVNADTDSSTYVFFSVNKESEQNVIVNKALNLVKVDIFSVIILNVIKFFHNF